MSDKPEFDYTLDDVARLSRSERESRVTRLISESYGILDRAVEEAAPGNGARGHEFRIGKFGGNSCVFGDFPRLCGRPESEHSTPPGQQATS